MTDASARRNSTRQIAKGWIVLPDSEEDRPRCPFKPSLRVESMWSGRLFERLQYFDDTLTGLVHVETSDGRPATSRTAEPSLADEHWHAAVMELATARNRA